MSFKRDGDDRHALNNQRKRRVTELLYEDIHEREVTKLSNGRYMCKTCRHGPIFDTINMFQVHRQGKKHQKGLIYHEEKAQELQDLILKRKQEEEIKSESHTKQSSVEEQIQQEVVFMKKKSQPYSRKMILDLNINNTESTTNTTPTDTLPGHRKDTKSLTDRPHLSRKQITSTDVTRKNIESFDPQSKSRESYSDRNKIGSAHLSTSSVLEHHDKRLYKSQSTSNEEQELNPSKIKQFLKHGGENSQNTRTKFYFSRRQQANSHKFAPYTQLHLEREHTVIERHTSVSWDKFKQMKGKHFVAPVYQRKIGTESSGKQIQANSNSTENKGEVNINMLRSTGNAPGCSIANPLINGNNSHHGGTNHNTAVASSKNEEKTRAHQVFNAYGAGWKRDWDGKWIRDEEAEFDSDEEPPTIT